MSSVIASGCVAVPWTIALMLLAARLDGAALAKMSLAVVFTPILVQCGLALCAVCLAILCIRQVCRPRPRPCVLCFSTCLFPLRLSRDKRPPNLINIALRGATGYKARSSPKRGLKVSYRPKM